MREETINIKDRISEACKASSTFEQMVKVCDQEINRFVENIHNQNNKPSSTIRPISDPTNTLVRIFLPIIPISPNETELLLEYLKDKYILGKDGRRIVGGDYFKIKNCIFKQNFKLTTCRDYY